MSEVPVQVGLEVCLDDPPAVLHGARIGLLMNQASVDARFRYAHELFAERFPGQVRAIFSPQHGLWGEQQANMVESPHGVEPNLGVPVYSLYSYVRRPTREMLDGIDVLVVDLQDVGTRVYTLIWTVSHCLEECADRGLSVVVLDRPNPIGGTIVEGPRLDPAYASFVGRAAIPMRHGMTIGELAGFVNDELDIGAAITVVPLRGWRRNMLYSETGRTWVAPSPNLPRLEGVGLYPGMVLFEGTNLSEGRGTTMPFEIVGAPFIDPDRLSAAMAQFELAGVVFRPIRFVPTFDKWQGQRCGGVFIHVVDAQAARPYRVGLAILAACKRLWPNNFAWNPPPYEYEYEKWPIDILAGGAAVRETIDSMNCRSEADLRTLAADAGPEWETHARPFHRYE
jgi:uncharacterized protein YbbC (DUF1343 family)